MLSAPNEPTVWISGDTVLTDELRSALPAMGADVAIIHCGGVRFPKAPVFGRMTFTFDVRQVVEALAQLGPEVSIPVHRSGWSHFEPETPLRAALDPASTRWLEPGESTTV